MGTCRRCGGHVEPAFAYCPHCGVALEQNDRGETAEGAAVRRRLGGTRWRPAV